jgi:pimeloyl-ACP methyl ester carboxylesterase
MPHAELPATSLFYERRGTGAPLLLIQGMSGTQASWGEPFLRELERHFDLVAYDHRGIGRSAPWRTPFTIVDLAQDARALLDHLGWERAHVLGISMGGMVAQELALEHPERIRTLALGCTYCGGEQAALAGPEILAMFRQAGGGGATPPGGVPATPPPGGVPATPPPGGTPPTPPPSGEGLLGTLAAHLSSGTLARMALAVPAPLGAILLQLQAVGGHDTSARLPGLRVPTLVLHGTRDPVLPAANGELIARLVPDARLELLDGAGHLFWLEQPGRTVELLREHARGSRATAA